MHVKRNSSFSNVLYVPSQSPCLDKVPPSTAGLRAKDGAVMPNPSHCIVCAGGNVWPVCPQDWSFAPRVFGSGGATSKVSPKREISDGHGLWPDLWSRMRCGKTAHAVLSTTILRQRIPWQTDTRNRVRQQNNIMALLYESFVHHRH